MRLYAYKRTLPFLYHRTCFEDSGFSWICGTDRNKKMSLVWLPQLELLFFVCTWESNLGIRVHLLKKQNKKRDSYEHTFTCYVRRGIRSRKLRATSFAQGRHSPRSTMVVVSNAGEGQTGHGGGSLVPQYSSTLGTSSAKSVQSFRHCS